MNYRRAGRDAGFFYTLFVNPTTAGASGQYDEKVRFFKNGVDPSSNMPGMGGDNFSNGFTISGSTQVYNDNSVESCVTSIKDKFINELNIFPNPFQNQFTFEIAEDIQSVQIFD